LVKVLNIDQRNTAPESIEYAFGQYEKTKNRTGVVLDKKVLDQKIEVRINIGADNQTQEKNYDFTVEQIMGVLGAEGKRNNVGTGDRALSGSLTKSVSDKKLEAMLEARICALYKEWQSRNNDGSPVPSETSEKRTRVPQTRSLQEDSQQRRQDQDQESTADTEKGADFEVIHVDAPNHHIYFPILSYIKIQIDNETFVVQRDDWGDFLVLKEGQTYMGELLAPDELPEEHRPTISLKDSVAILPTNWGITIKNPSCREIVILNPNKEKEDKDHYEPNHARKRDWDEFFDGNEEAAKALERIFKKRHLEPNERIALVLDSLIYEDKRQRIGEKKETSLIDKPRFTIKLPNGREYEIPEEMHNFLMSLRHSYIFENFQPHEPANFTRIRNSY
jgi:hypothetical protein